jgi:ribosomal protein S4
MTMNVAERAETARDLRKQIQGLDAGDEREIIFRDTSPARRRVSLWSLVNGEEIRIPSYMAEKVIEKTLEDGTYMFTAKQEDAPAYTPGKVKCFLHRESIERLVLNELGVSNICPAGELANNYSKRVHAQHRHKAEWAMYQEFLSEKKEADANSRQERQMTAMESLAGKAAEKGVK